jgi:hypothetical protein
MKRNLFWAAVGAVTTLLVLFALTSLSIVTLQAASGALSAPQEAKKLTPADGHDIHVTAPHLLNGKVMGPYHHYCKVVSDSVIECLIYESTDPKALLKQVEYFVAKDVARSNVSLATWNEFYHDHAIEIASGRVQVLDRSPEEAKKIADAAAQTDGIIFHLWWPDDAKTPSGVVMHPQAVGHTPRAN